MPYSARAREGAPVAAPISWDELDEMPGGNRFTVRDAELLLERASGRLLQGGGEAGRGATGSRCATRSCCWSGRPGGCCRGGARRARCCRIFDISSERCPLVPG